MTTLDYQISFWNILEDLESRLRQAERSLRQRRRPRGPHDQEGNLRERGRKLGYCIHLDCGGQRSVWNYRGIKVCARHWRGRKALYALFKNSKERKAA